MIDQETLARVELIAFDFDGVFTDNTVYVTQEGVESVRCWRSDGLGLSRLRDIGVRSFVISTETNPVVSVRANKLKLPCKQGVDDKAAVILETCRELSIDPRNAMFVGNDINDIPAFRSIGVPVAVADAYPEVYPHVVYRTRRPGGHGAVREICDLIFHARQGTLNEYESYAT
jgi:3-deoxy-D-manno-octulosonate 8-phosphate phosphatase (KDO 8-P phosphatase)